MSRKPHALFSQAIAVTALAVAGSATVSGRAYAAAPLEDAVTALQPAALCGAPVTAALTSIAPLEPAASAAKSSAILGGRASALEQVRLAQESSVPAAFAQDQLEPQLHQVADLAPAAGGVRPEGASCTQYAISYRLDRIDPARPGGEYLGSRRVKIGHTAFDRDWRRVSRDAITNFQFRQLLGRTPDDTMGTLQAVNAWVNGRIDYVEDGDLFDRPDFWAGARRTLRLRKGDCEDIALTKMQLLAAAGIRRDQMSLTIARDLARNADHAVLIVHHNGRQYLLDNSTDELLDASERHDYRPVLSFSAGQAWLHGY